MDKTIVTGTNSKDQVYYAIDYLRLSKEDRDAKAESNSIANQRKLIQDYVKKSGNIELVDEAIDDGYTGTNYNRPGFQKVLDLIEAGTINCVIVKDLSRMGREYIETGKYIEMTFPAKNIRFIAINDDVDSENRSSNDDLMIPFKNLMNENYCRELSQKLRRQFKIQRENGEFMASFSAYGYKRSPEDKHKLIIDEFAAEVVRGIFSMTIKGFSPARIAKYLNDNEIMAPYEYKRQTSKYTCGFKGPGKSVWNHNTIGRILRNPVYVGTLVQGKTASPSFKVKKQKALPKEQWAIVENCHEAIIDEHLFAIVQNILSRDIRMSTEEQEIMPLAGSVYCGDCGGTMCRRSVKRGEKAYYYYWCGTYRASRECTTHNISQKELEKSVLGAIKNHIKVLIDLKELEESIDLKSAIKKKIEQYEIVILEKTSELEKYADNSVKLYDAYIEEMVSKQEYIVMKESYGKKINELTTTIAKLKSEKEQYEAGNQIHDSWITIFLKYQDIKELTHEMVVSLIDRIEVFEDKRIQITFNFKNELEEYVKLLQLNSEKEVG